MRLVFLAAFLLVAQDPTPKYSKHFEDKDAGEITVEAVCSINDDNVTCWDAQGAPAPKIAEEVKISVSKNWSGVRFAFGAINRYVVATVHAKSNNQLMVQTNFGAQGPSLEQMTQLETPQPRPGDGWTQRNLYWVKIEKAEQMIQVPFTYWVPFAGTFELKIAKDSTSTIRDRTMSFRLARPGYGPTNYPQDSLRRPDFELAVGTKGIPKGSDYVATFCDAAGEEIRAVDASGKAVDANLQQREESERQMLFNSGSAVPEKKYWPVSPAFGGFQQSDLVIHTPINPESIASVKLTVRDQVSAIITDIPVLSK